MPGLIALSPPRKTARGREQDRLLVYVLLTGNATFSVSEYKKIASDSAAAYYHAAGTVTSALRTGAESVNQALLERNRASSGSGQHVTGFLTLACLRAANFTFLVSGPLHIFWLGQSGFRHIHEPELSGKGLGLGESVVFHLSQFPLLINDQLLLCSRLPSAWQGALTDGTRSSVEATRRRLLTLTNEDLNALLIQAVEGPGSFNLLHSPSEPSVTGLPAAPEAETVAKADAPVEDPSSVVRAPSTDSHSHPTSVVRSSAADPGSTPAASSPTPGGQPSAYAIPVSPPVPIPSASARSDLLNSKAVSRRDFPASIPRAASPPGTHLPAPLPRTPSMGEPKSTVAMDASLPGDKPVVVPANPLSRIPIRSLASALVHGIQSGRRLTTGLGRGLKSFLPRLLPGTESTQPFIPTTTLMVFFAILIPILVVTVAFTVYSKYGRSIQYETAMAQAVEASKQARTLSDPVEQRKAWETVMLNVEQAENFRRTSDARNLKEEAGVRLDGLLGILRLQFTPAFSSPLGIDISRMAASETDLFLLDASSGAVLHADLSESRGFRMDTGFNCSPGVYGGYTVGPLVDILALPGLNSLKATVLGVDATGNLLYCEAGQVAQAIPLSPPDTNWGRVTAFNLEAGNLYVLDAPARAVWVYPGVGDAFIDRPYFFFGDQTPEKQDVIDLAVSGDDLYMLHADGHLSTCSYSRIEAVPTRCQDPAQLTNPYPASRGEDTFTQANFTQMFFTAPPDQSILLLDADSQAVFRMTPRSLELQNQLRPTTGASNPVVGGPVGAMAVSPNHVLYLAVNGQVYFATGMP